MSFAWVQPCPRTFQGCLQESLGKIALCCVLYHHGLIRPADHQIFWLMVSSTTLAREMTKRRALSEFLPRCFRQCQAHADHRRLQFPEMPRLRQPILSFS